MAAKSGSVRDPPKGRRPKPDELMPADGPVEAGGRKNAERALRHHDEAPKIRPNDVRIARGWRSALANMKLYDEAHDAIDCAMAENPDDPAAAAAMIKLLKAEERHKDTLALAEASAKKRSGGAGPGADLPALRRKVVLEERRLRMVDKRLLEDPDKTVKEIEESADEWRRLMPGLWPDTDAVLARDYADMYLEKCKILNNLSRHEEALEAAESALRCGRDCSTWTGGDSPRAGFMDNYRTSTAMDAKIETLFRLGRYEDALACCRDAWDELGHNTFVEGMMAKLQKLGHG